MSFLLFSVRSSSHTEDSSCSSKVWSEARFLDTSLLSCRLHQHVDFVVCLGGDGTILHASSLFQRAIPPVVSFSAGSLGFLTNHSLSNVEADLRNVIYGCEDLVQCSLEEEASLHSDSVSSFTDNTYHVDIVHITHVRTAPLCGLQTASRQQGTYCCLVVIEQNASLLYSRPSSHNCDLTKFTVGESEVPPVCFCTDAGRAHNAAHAAGVPHSAPGPDRQLAPGAV